MNTTHLGIALLVAALILFACALYFIKVPLPIHLCGPEESTATCVRSWLSALGPIIAIAALIVALLQFQLAWRSSERQIRAYVGLTIAALEGSVRPNVPVTVKFRAENFGQTPARRVRVRHRSYVAATTDISMGSITAKIDDYEMSPATAETTIHPKSPIDPLVLGLRSPKTT
jgi:hypothetical protein